MNEEQKRHLNPEDVSELHDELRDVPTYRAPQASPAKSIYERTGKAAPTEVFPSAQPATPEPATAQPTAAQPLQPPVAEPTQVLPTGATEIVPPATAADAAVVAEEPAFVTEPEPVVVEQPRALRGTMDLGLFLLRLFVGGYLIIDAVRLFFGLGGSQGIAGLENAFSTYAYGNLLAIVMPTFELAAGVFLVLGLLAPVAAMIAVAVTGFYAVHAVATTGAGGNLFAWDETVWLQILLVGTAIALQFTGPGFYGVDAGRSWARRPLASSWIFAVLGIAAAALVWWFGAGVNPLA